MTELVNTDRLEKIARMALFEVPQKQIAHAIGLSEGRISQLVDSDEYKNILEKLAVEYFEKYTSLDDGWDTVEALAMNNIIDHLNWSKDADYALKAATMANRANRRGQINNRALDGRAGVRAVIHLSAQFVDKLQVNNINGTQDNGKSAHLTLRSRDNRTGVKQKDNDFMPPEEVEKIFVSNIKREKDEDENLLDFLPSLMVAE